MTSPFQALCKQLSELEQQLDYTFKNKELLTQAFIHRSFLNENALCPISHNERLEFLGDAVLGLMAAELVYRDLPDTPEGELTHIRARLVEASSCHNYMQKLAVGDAILVGKGEARTGGRGRYSIEADLFEAIIGAIYLDGGFAATEKWFFSHFREEVNQILATPVRNWKAELQDYSQKNTHAPPHYEILTVEGPDHEKRYQVAVHVDNEQIGVGNGRSKKEAQQAAAKMAIEAIEEESSGED